MRTVPLLTLVLAGLLAVPGLAQTPPAGAPTEIRGTVEALGRDAVTLRSRDGTPLTIALAANLTVLGMAKKDADDILTGDYVSAIGVKAAVGKLPAVEIRVYPDSMR